MPASDALDAKGRNLLKLVIVRPSSEERRAFVVVSALAVGMSAPRRQQHARTCQAATHIGVEALIFAV
jgi:hypothetical protein